MTTEDDFQARLDDDPTDWQTRLVLADWLDEHGDARAAGYRALAACRFVLCDRYHGDPPRYIPHQTSRIFCDTGDNYSGRDYTLPRDWFKAVGRAAGRKADEGCIPFDNRRAAEDAAARAFAKLPPNRRAELLRGEIGS